jgi:hypothetical protein
MLRELLVKRVTTLPLCERGPGSASPCQWTWSVMRILARALGDFRFESHDQSLNRRPPLLVETGPLLLRLSQQVIPVSQRVRIDWTAPQSLCAGNRASEVGVDGTVKLHGSGSTPIERFVLKNDIPR